MKVLRGIIEFGCGQWSVSCAVFVRPISVAHFWVNSDPLMSRSVFGVSTNVVWCTFEILFQFHQNQVLNHLDQERKWSWLWRPCEWVYFYHPLIPFDDKIVSPLAWCMCGVVCVYLSRVRRGGLSELPRTKPFGASGFWLFATLSFFLKNLMTHLLDAGEGGPFFVELGAHSMGPQKH